MKTGIVIGMMIIIVVYGFAFFLGWLTGSA